MSDGAAVAARAAATTVFVRDGDDGLEVCLLRRHPQSGFVAGAHVFAGGAVDPEDVSGAHCVTGLDDREASRLTGVGSGGLRFWVAAVRESFEETGVLPGVVAGAAQHARLQACRRDVHAGRVQMAAALESVGLGIDGRSLRCFARWVTPVMAPRRYDTRFFVAHLPEGQVVAEDGAELVHHEWLRPVEALRRHGAGEMFMIMPTVRTLVALSGFTSAQSVMAGLTFGRPGEPLLPEVVEDGGEGRLLRLASDPEGNGGLYCGTTAMPAVSGPP